jgi:hypothetical protein
MKGKTGIVLAQMCRGDEVAEALISQVDVPHGFMVGFGTQPGFISFIYKSGTPYFKEVANCIKKMANSSWQDILYIVAQRVGQKKIRYNQRGRPAGFLATQEPDHFINCPEKIPLKDEGKIQCMLFNVITDNVIIGLMYGMFFTEPLFLSALIVLICLSL